jgi:2-iminobutanoate/2-iminopropanoate deaminase
VSKAKIAKREQNEPREAVSNRRKFLTKAPVIAAAAAAAAAVAGPASAPAQAAQADGKPAKKVFWSGGKKPEKTPLFSPAVAYGNLLFISGIGAHFEGDIKAHTKHVLDEIKKKLEECGSSMEKVLKVNVYLNDLKDYQAMNEVFLGSFGAEPGVRTTIAAAGGIPGNSLVEIDCIAYI